MAQREPKYFLKIDESIIDFSSIPELKDLNLNCFLELNLFTSLYENELELFNALKTLGFFIDNDFNDISIVKRTGTKKEGYKYKLFSSDILFNNGLELLLPKNIESFLVSNRNNFEMISKLLETYKKDFLRLSTIYNKRYREAQMANDSIDEKALSSLKFILYNIEEELKIINYLFKCIDIFNNSEYKFDRDLELKYINLLISFVEKEIQYKNNKNSGQNTRGLFRMASRISNVLYMCPKLDFSFGNHNPYKSIQEKMLQTLNRVHILRNMSDNITYRATVNYTLDEDPDEFMFLEEEDFINIPSNQSKEVLESISVDLENLEEKKSRMKG